MSVGSFLSELALVSVLAAVVYDEFEFGWCLWLLDFYMFCSAGDFLKQLLRYGVVAGGCVVVVNDIGFRGD